MGGLPLLSASLDWSTSCRLFEWTLEHVIARLSDVDAVALLREIVGKNLCCLAFAELSSSARREFVGIVRTSLLDAAELELPQTVLQQLGELVGLPGQSIVDVSSL